MEYTKQDEATLAVTKTPEVKEEVVEYKLDFLKQQELDILRQKNEFVEARNKELEEVRNLIAKCEELGIKSAVEIEIAKEEIIEITK